MMHPINIATYLQNTGVVIITGISIYGIMFFDELQQFRKEQLKKKIYFSKHEFLILTLISIGITFMFTSFVVSVYAIL